MDTYDSDTCIGEDSRVAITPLEKISALLMIPLYGWVCFITISNILLFYNKERKKNFDFLPKLQFLLFTSSFCMPENNTKQACVFVLIPS